MRMAGVIDLSSDDEDYQEKPTSLNPVVVKREPTLNNGTLANLDGANIPENGQQRPHPPPILLLNSSAATRVRSPGLRKGRTLIPKIEDSQDVLAVSQMNRSPQFSSWGDPLPPESASHPLQDLGEGQIFYSAGGVAPGNGSPAIVSTGNGSDDDIGRAAEVGSSSPTLDSISPGSPGALCRHFWRAGDYEAQHSGARPTRGAMDHVRVHPKFLHSNATSHKWALGAVAELLDNAVDEIPNGATFVSVDKAMNPRDGHPALRVQDDGGGMSPDCMRQCMSLGYSGKNTNTTIGQYGNGFKTSTMRLGADVIVFSRCGKEGGTVTQSIGLLSYTFLRKTGQEDVIVPMVDYEVSSAGLKKKDPFQRMVRTTLDDWHSNLTSIMQWSPYASESELLHQFDDLGWHGTKVVIYNLWFNDDGVLELDFSSDETDIQLRGGVKTDKNKPVSQQLANGHISNRYHHSLRVYTSILYLKMPPGFQIILRGKPVEHHCLAADLKFPEQIIYKPLIGNRKDPPKETSVITIIGFTKEAPLINVHGFNVYHKNRLIMPFWKVWQDNSSRGRGVVGVLEANFVEPAHDKQDFERTTVLLKLESRLKQMTVEYWNLHCHYIGYQPHSKAGKSRKQSGSVDYPLPVASITPAGVEGNHLPRTPLTAEALGVPESAPAHAAPAPARQNGPQVKPEPVDEGVHPAVARKINEGLDRFKRRRMEEASVPVAISHNVGMEIAGTSESALVVQQSSQNETMVVELMQENGQLKARCTELEQEVKGLSSKILKLESELREAVMKNVILQALRVSKDKAAAGR